MRPITLVYLCLATTLLTACGQLHQQSAATSSVSNPSASGVDVSSRDALLDELQHARMVEAASYLLPPAMTDAIAAVCRRGGSSAVVLASPDYDREIADENAQTVRDLKSSGCNAETVTRPWHIKAVVIDGHDAYLSDTNFSRDGFILRVTDTSMIALLRQTIGGQPGATNNFATLKGAALNDETALIGQSRGALCISTESFGRSNVADAIAAYDGTVDLVVAEREASHSDSEMQLLRDLQTNGRVRVRLLNADEKIAAGTDLAYLGSSNATAGYPEQADWGLLTDDPALVRFAQARCASDFSQGTPI
jgi:hypothetical protein